MTVNNPKKFSEIAYEHMTDLIRGLMGSVYEPEDIDDLERLLVANPYLADLITTRSRIRKQLEDIEAEQSGGAK
jgi:hypothetical protein